MFCVVVFRLTGANRKNDNFYVKAVVNGSVNNLFMGLSEIKGKSGGKDMAEKCRACFEVC